MPTHSKSSVLENEIDGETLLMLIDDLEEFSLLVPKAVSRLKLKKIVREFDEPSNSCYKVCSLAMTPDC